MATRLEAEYNENQKKIDSQLELIKKALTKERADFKQDSSNWGFHGNSESTTERLAELLTFLTGEE